MIKKSNPFSGSFGKKRERERTSNKRAVFFGINSINHGPISRGRETKKYLGGGFLLRQAYNNKKYLLGGEFFLGGKEIMLKGEVNRLESLFRFMSVRCK